MVALATVFESGADLAPGMLVVMMPLDRILPDPQNDRFGTIDDPVLEAFAGLVESIRERGVLEPVQIYPVEDGYYMLRSGHRRRAAATAVGLAAIPALIVEPPASELDRAIDRLTANLQRSDLTDPELAQSIQSALDEDDELTQADLARLLGLSPARVSNLLRLFDLDIEVLALWREGKLKTGHVLPLLAVQGPIMGWDYTETPGSKWRIECAKNAMREGLSVREVESRVRGVVEADKRYRQYQIAEKNRKAEEKAQAADPVAKQQQQDEAAKRKEQQAKDDHLRAERGRVSKEVIGAALHAAPALEMLRFAVLSTCENWRNGENHNRPGFGTITAFRQQVRTATTERQLRELLIRISLELVELDYYQPRLLTWGFSKMADEQFDLNPLVQRAFVAAGLMAPPPAEVGDGNCPNCGLEIQMRSIPGSAQTQSEFNCPNCQEAIILPGAWELVDQAVAAEAAPSVVVLADDATAAAGEYEQKVRAWLQEHADEYPDANELADWCFADLMGEGAEISEDDFDQLVVWAKEVKGTDGQTQPTDADIAKWIETHAAEFSTPDSLASAAIFAVLGEGKELPDSKYSILMSFADMSIVRAGSAAERPKF